MEAQGVLKLLEYSDWATPIVPVKKQDGTVRIYGDYKITVNKHLKPHAHKVPSVNYLLSRVDGGKIFAKLDISHAYLQLAGDDQTAKMQAIATHKGTFALTRLQFGIGAAQGIFQSLMEQLLGPLDEVMPFFDDFIVIRKDQRDFIQKLPSTLKVLADNGLRLKKEKCALFCTSFNSLID